MSMVLISNVTFNDKDYFNEFIHNKEYKHFGISSSSSTLVPYYKELLKEVLGNQINETIKDKALITEQIVAIKEIFERELEDHLPRIESLPEYGGPINKVIYWKDNEYPLRLSLTRPISRRIADFYNIVEICRECLSEDKPMYLSIE